MLRNTSLAFRRGLVHHNLQTSYLSILYCNRITDLRPFSTEIGKEGKNESTVESRKLDAKAIEPAPKPQLPDKQSKYSAEKVWKAIKEGAHHAYHGTKLLFKEIAISYKLVRKLLDGKQLTRRERKQVKLCVIFDSSYLELHQTCFV
jgi:hypothetical protein